MRPLCRPFIVRYSKITSFKKMDIFSFLKQKGAAPDPTDELLYEYVASELKNSLLKEGLWTKSLADNDWNESRAKAQYVNMRIAQLKEELRAQVTYEKQSLLNDPTLRATAGGLDDEEIEYLGKPIEASIYTKNYGVSLKKLEKAIKLGQIRAVFSQGVLWVQNQEIA